MIQKSELCALRGKRIAFVTAGYAGKRFIYEKAKSLGVSITIIDSPTSWSQALVKEGIIDHFVSVDFGKARDAIVSEIVDKLAVAGIELDGVCTFAELSLPVCAKLARTLNLPGPDPEVVALVRDKHKVRQLVAKSGLNEVRSYAIKSVNDLQAASEFVGFPSVLKPISGADSLGVKKVDNMSQLREALLQVQEVVAGLVVNSGALCRSSSAESTEPEKQAGRFIALDLSLEEYLDGPEVDVDIVLFENECYFVSVVDNGPTVEPYFAETWNLCPSTLDASRQSQLIVEALATVKALGFKSGVFHVEERFTSRGPRIIEVNARMGGGPIRLQHKQVYGVDLVVEQLFSCIGFPPSCWFASQPAQPKTPNLCYVSATPNVEKSGVIASVGFLDEIKKRPDVCGIWEFVVPGEAVVGPEDGQPTWLCEIALMGNQGSESLLKTMLTLTDKLVADVQANYYTPQ